VAFLLKTINEHKVFVLKMCIFFGLSTVIALHRLLVASFWWLWRSCKGNAKLLRQRLGQNGVSWKRYCSILALQ